MARQLALMALLGAGLLLFEVLLTRVLAITLFANLAFAAVALALLGMAIGGWIAARHERLDDDQQLRRVQLALLLAAIGAVLAIIVTTALPLVPAKVFAGDRAMTSWATRWRAVRNNPLQLNFWAIAPALALQMVPFAGAAYAQALLLARRSERAGRLYAADVAGACAGAWSGLLLLPLLGALNAVAVVMLLFVAAAALVPLPRRRRAAAAMLVIATAALVIAGARPLEIRHAAGFTERRVVDTSWSALTRVSLYDEAPPQKARDGEPTLVRRPQLQVDNTSRTRVAFVGEPQYRENLDRYASSLRPEGAVLIIGAGGGQEIVGALETAAPGTVRAVDAVEVAGGIPTLMRRHFADRPGFVLDQPGVAYTVADGRSFVEMHNKTWSVIQMKEVNFHSLAGQASAAWSPSLLFTVEAYESYLARLADDGLLSIVKFYGGSGNTSTMHMLATIRAAADRRGLDLCPRTVLIDREYSYGRRRLILIGRAALTDHELDAIERRARATKQKVVRSPRAPASILYVEQLLCGADDEAIDEAYRAHGAMLEPTRDDRPFGHQHLSYVSALKQEQRAGAEADVALQSANVRALTGIIGGFVLLTLGLMTIFVRQAPRGARRRATSQLALFAALGLGFMLLEIVLLERSSLLLGHPTVGVVTVLTAMLLALAAGSALSERLVPERRALARRALVIATLVGVAALPPVLPALAPWLRGISPTLRPAIIGGVILIGATPLGLLLPTALRVIGRDHAARVSSCWAINGATSVLGTVSAALLVRTVGFTSTAHVALVAYVIAVALWVWTLRAGARDPS